MDKTIILCVAVVMLLLANTTVGQTLVTPATNLWEFNSNVGIGTSTPTEKLSVYGRVRLGAEGLGGASTRNGVLVGSNGTRTEIRFQHWGNDSSPYFAVDPAIDAQKLLIGVNQKDMMVINAGGNVGIGTTSPLARLEVDQGETNNLGLALSSSGAGWGSGLLLKNTSTAGNMYGIYSGADGLLHFANAGKEVDDMIIHPSGNIGIGTRSPDSKLTVAGNVHAREVKVTVAAGADFVFEEDYKLPSLEETEQFVRQNKHLPGIAPAAEMEREGLELGQMNILLLQKIEELTLHLIDHQKVVQRLQQRLQHLENRDLTK